MSDKIKFGKRGNRKRKKDKKHNVDQEQIQNGETAVTESHYNTIATLCGGSTALDAALGA